MNDMCAIMVREPNPLLLVAPVCASLLLLSQWPGAPEQDRWTLGLPT